MEGLNCIVTGGNAGIGFETSLALAKKGHQVIVIARNAQKGRDAVEKIMQLSGNQNVELIQADLSSQKQVREASKKIAEKYQTVDRLINNAGTWFSRQSITADGIETQFAVNHLAYFLMTHELLPLLQKSKAARIINVSSDSHFKGKIYQDNINLDHKYHGLRAYAQSKLANVMFTYEFERRNPFKNIAIYALQPGLVKTDIGLKHTLSLHGLIWKIRRSGGVSPAEGAKTSVFLATSDEVQTQSGKYWDKCKSKPSSKRSYREDDQRALWEKCQKLCGIEDYFYQKTPSGR